MPTLMVHHRRRLILRKLTRHSRIRRIIDQKIMANLPIEEGSESESEEEVDFPLPPGFDVPFDRIPFMSKQERAKWRNKHPNLPPYLFMTEKEKRLYFIDRSQNFQNEIKRMPQKTSRIKKRVSFNKFFDVKPFKKLEAATQIANTQSFKDNYRQFHSS